MKLKKEENGALDTECGNLTQQEKKVGWYEGSD
jgi:hypothetical protein